MPEVLVSAAAVVPRTIELLNDPSLDLMRVLPPVLRVVHRSKIQLGYGGTVAMWAVDRPGFAWDEAVDGRLPY